MKLKICMLLCTLVLSKAAVISQVGNDNNSFYHEYFSTLPLRESPYPDFRGVVRLTKDAAFKRNHYDFKYDENFSLVAITFKLGDRIINPNHTANYFFTTPQQRFEYDGNKEIRTFFDRFGNQITQRKAFREVYFKDNNGRYNKLYFEDKIGNRIENSWGVYEYNWEVQNDGSIIENRVDQNGKEVSLRPGFEFYTVRLYYHQNGMLALMQNINQEGLKENSTGVAQDKLHFDKKGRWLGWTVLDANHKIKRGNGPNVAKGINLTDENGYERFIKYENVDGSAIINSHGFWGGKRFYDKFGNYDYTHFVDKNYNPGINEESGYSIAKYTWSDDGLNRLSIQLLDVRNKPVLHRTRGYAFIKQEYNDDGNVVKTSFLGLNGELINRTDNQISYIHYEYDENKKLIGTKTFKKNGNEIK